MVITRTMRTPLEVTTNHLSDTVHPEGWIPPYIPTHLFHDNVNANAYDEYENVQPRHRRGHNGVRGNAYNNHGDRGYEERRQVQPNHNSRRNIKVKIENFIAEYDAAIFLDWLQATEHALQHCHYSKEETVEIATLQFQGAARSWWHRDVANRARMGCEPIRQWHQLIFIMTQKYFPPVYKNEMRLKIALARQGTQTPLEFFAQLKDLYFKAVMSVTPATIRTKFLHGLHVDLREEIDVLPIKDITADSHMPVKSCPNPRKVFFCQATVYESFDDEEDNGEDPRTVYDDLADEEPYACGPPNLNEGTPLSLVARLALIVKDASVGDQREILFHTRCLLVTSSLSVIINSGSCCNILNERVVRVLNLPMSPHPQPYSLQWNSEGKGDVVTRKCHITFSIGTYVDTVTCDVVIMDATHLLLGRPWQYDKKTVPDRFFNTHTFQ
ncbi:uncharacterized protein LOC125369800 [Ricinus communis]|uniref:uncharacterized protein LOC125369800 n=1 Tax=Ricinus communis TaxID=3988 RepID=UPI00201B088A|nr:uncharacterized protein LOC125369800 [Ricinus communis]